MFAMLPIHVLDIYNYVYDDILTVKSTHDFLMTLFSIQMGRNSICALMFNTGGHSLDLLEI